MAEELNEVRIDGRLVEAPRVQTFPSGQKLVTLRIANNRWFVDPTSTMRETTEQFEVVARNALASLAGKLQRGQAVRIDGVLALDQWKDLMGRQQSKVVIEASRIHSRLLLRLRSTERRGRIEGRGAGIDL